MSDEKKYSDKELDDFMKHAKDILDVLYQQGGYRMVDVGKYAMSLYGKRMRPRLTEEDKAIMREKTHQTRLAKYKRELEAIESSKHTSADPVKLSYKQKEKMARELHENKGKLQQQGKMLQLFNMVLEGHITKEQAFAYGYDNSIGDLGSPNKHE